jgi:hypothetical protein
MFTFYDRGNSLGVVGWRLRAIEQHVHSAVSEAACAAQYVHSRKRRDGRMGLGMNGFFSLSLGEQKP